LSLCLWVCGLFLCATNSIITNFDKPGQLRYDMLFGFLLLLLVIVSCAGVLVYSAASRSLAAKRWNDLWLRIVSSCGLTGLVCRVFNFVYVPVNLLFGTLGLCFCLYVGAANLAFVMLHFGQYSLAEYLNQLAQPPYVGRAYALTTAHCDTRHVCKMKSFVYEPAKIGAIARVYGEDSIQLGHHYQLLANDYLNLALENKKSKYLELASAEFRIAERFAIKSERISRMHRDNVNTTESIGIIAMSRLGREDRAGARAALLDVLDCPPLVAQPGPICTSDEDLWYVAKQINDPQLLARIRPRIERNDLASRSALELLRQSELDPDTTWVKVALISSLLLILVKDSERSILTILFARRWRRQLALCASSNEQIKLLDNLTTLYLYDKKFDKADSCSKLMLRRAEELG